VYLGNRKVVTIDPGASMHTEIDPRSGQDFTGDKLPELIVSQGTGGAHCCSSTTVYSLSTELKTLLDIQTGNCPGDFEDLDHDASAVLTPVLDLMYVGRFDEGVALLRRLYRRADASDLERQTIEKVRSSPLWVPISNQ